MFFICPDFSVQKIRPNGVSYASTKFDHKVTVLWYQQLGKNLIIENKISPNYPDFSVQKSQAQRCRNTQVMPPRVGKTLSSITKLV